MRAFVSRLTERLTDMIWIVWIVLALYALPLFGILFSLFVSDGFRVESSVVYVVGTIADEFLRELRVTFGTIVVPLLTAFAVKTVGADEKVPPRTMAIFLSLAALLVLSVIAFGLVTYSREPIIQHDKKVYDAFQSLTVAYSKEFLTYIALTIGISLKRTSS